MRIRTLFAITLTMFALPAVAAELPGTLPQRQMPAPVLPDAPEPSVCYEVRILKVPAGFDFADRAGVQVNGEVILTEAELRQVLKAAQAHRDTSVMHLPRITVANAETARLSTCETQLFVTGLEAKKGKGAPVLVPKNMPVELGDKVVLTGSITGDGKSVRVHSNYTRAWIDGKVELLPVTTQITPVFEGGSQGKPIPFTQFLQVPDVKTGKSERTMTVPADGTYVLGGWKECAKYDSLALATVRLPRAEPAAMAPPVVPPVPPAGRVELPVRPAELPAVVYKLKNIAAADAEKAISAHLEGKNLKITLVAEPVSNTLMVSGESAACVQAAELITKLDKEPQQVMVQVTVVQAPRGFAEECGLTTDTTNGVWTLSPREQQMFNGLLRAAKERGTLDVLARPQVCVKDGQAGFVQVGQQVPALTDTAVKQIEYVSTGMTLKVTPRVSPDGKSVSLDANYNHTELAPGLVPLGERATAAFTTQQMDTQTDVRFGESLVFRTSALNRPSFSGVLARHCRGRDEVETLVIMTPTLVRPEPAPRPVRPLRWFR